MNDIEKTTVADLLQGLLEFLWRAHALAHGRVPQGEHGEGRMKTLTLTIAEPWFSMIRDGKKKEEYREIKDHYLHQFYNYSEMQKFFGIPPQPYHFDRPQVFHTKQFQKHFDLLTLRNGYRADSPKVTLKNPKIRIGTGRPEWGAEYGKQYFIITWEA